MGPANRKEGMNSLHEKLSVEDGQDPVLESYITELEGSDDRDTIPCGPPPAAFFEDDDFPY